ncbi:FAD-dependent oxidoreductase [Streptomyces sp. NPDC090026]|uniref:FAD-dependent oxidoreductase n=1 Tax=Streptomyces sp. NPDC090026 TaxID=3365923 RepID=UPI0037F133F9
MRIGVVGAGLAGLGAARRALELGSRVEIFEEQETVGGLASSLRAAGLAFDLGPHTLYAREPEVLRDLEDLLGTVLRPVRPTRGIWRDGRLYRFPFHLGDFARVAGPLRAAPPLLAYLAARAGGWMADRIGRADPVDLETWAVRGLGRPLYAFFVLDHVTKNIGLPPSRLPALWGRQRIAVPRLGTGLAQLAGREEEAPASRYPEGGIGRIAAALADRVAQDGGLVRTGARLVSWARAAGHIVLRADTRDGPVVRTVDSVVNTGPVGTFLLGADTGTVPEPVRAAAARLRHRATVFVYTSTRGVPADLPRDLLYFPGKQVFSRAYTPRGYAGGPAGGAPAGHCFEIHCDPGDELWDAPDGELGARVLRDAARLPFLGDRARLRVERIVRIRRHYPLSEPGSAELRAVEHHLDRAAPHVVSAGRLGSHRYVNMDSALRMGALAAEVAHGRRPPGEIRRVADDPAFVEGGGRGRCGGRGR